ncbi:MAG: hypothetical protein ABIT83_18315 [Massilia sp.]
MKSLYLCSGVTGALALACALGLAGCGGSPAELSLGGSVSGLTKPGLVLQNNGGPDLAVPSGSTSFYFPDLIASDEKYNVTIKTQPTGATCTVSSGSGRSAYNVSSVVVSCVTFSFDVGGTINGLPGPNGPSGAPCAFPNQTGKDQCLVLNNGSVTKAFPYGTTTFNMTTPISDSSGNVALYYGRVTDDLPYGITIFQQPTGKTCSITNGVGVMAGAAVTNLKVDCI